MTTATQNSRRLSRQKRTNSAGLIRPSTATTTMQPSVASGRSLSTPPRKSAHATASATVTSSLSCVLAPARWLIAVCEKPPADGIARKNAPSAQARPLGERAPGRCRSAAPTRRTLRATASVSRNTMIAIAKCAREQGLGVVKRRPPTRSLRKPRTVVAAHPRRDLDARDRRHPSVTSPKTEAQSFFMLTTVQPSDSRLLERALGALAVVELALRVVVEDEQAERRPVLPAREAQHRNVAVRVAGRDDRPASDPTPDPYRLDRPVVEHVRLCEVRSEPPCSSSV